MDGERLLGVGPFEGLDAAGRSRVARTLTVRTVPAGADLLVEGRPADRLAVLLHGEASVHRRQGGERQELAVLGHGAFVGELSLLRPGTPATATVTALGDVEVVEATGEAGRALLDDPVVGPPIRAAAERRLATNRITELGPVHLTLPDGSGVALRPLWPDDWRLMEAGQHRASRQTLYQRFFSVPKVTEQVLRRLATVDFVDDFAWIALDTAVTADLSDDLLGVGRYARLREEPELAEIALLVTDDCQRTGLGTRLLVALAVAAEHHGIEGFEAVALSTNRAIQRLLSRAGATWQMDPDDPAHVWARWPVADVLDHLGQPSDVAALQALVRQGLAPG